MKIDITQSRLEKDFETFLKLLPCLDGTQFSGLCKVLNVSMIHLTETGGKHKERIEDARLNITKDMTDEERKNVMEEAKKKFPPLTMEEILDKVMDQFLALGKRQRKEVLQLLKDVKRGS